MSGKKNDNYGCGSIVALLVIFAFLIDFLPLAVALIVMAIIIFVIYKNISKKKNLEKIEEKDSNQISDNKLEDSIKRKNEVISEQNFDISQKNRRIEELENELRKERLRKENSISEKEYQFPQIEELDPYIWEAANLIIEKDNCSIGLLQRTFKIGFNRADRIVKFLCSIGVVGEEDGYKSRDVLVDKAGLFQIAKELEKKGIFVSDERDDCKPYNTEIKQEERIQMYNNQFDYMTGEDFESYVATILKRIGYENIQLTKGSGDQGVDILAEKDGIKYAIQCKRYSQAVGNKAVQEVFSGKFFYHCHTAIVVTNNYFTQSAKELAHENGVVLWDRDKLKSLSFEVQSKTKVDKTKIENKTDGNEVRNTCIIMTSIILETYRALGLNIRFLDFKHEYGYAVFAIVPFGNTKVKDVMSCEKDLSLRLGAEIKLKIVSGNGYIGVYMPIINFKIRMDEMMNDEKFQKLYKECEDSEIESVD